MIEAIARRQHEPDDRFLAAEAGGVLDELGKHRFRGARSDYDQQLGANVAHQMPQTDPIPIRNGPEDETDEQDTGQIELADHCAQRDKRAYTESAYGEADRAHRADRRYPHAVANDLEQNSIGGLDCL